MQRIILEIADNGIIKTVTDDNINAAGERFESKTVYDLENGDVVDTKMTLLYELSEDMGMELGNSKQKDQIKIIATWGADYTPSTKDEIVARLQELVDEMKDLESMLEDMK